MKPARFEVTTAILSTDKIIDGKAVTFIARGKVLLFDGWLSLTTDKTEEGKMVSLDDQQLPPLNKKQSLTSQKTDVLTKHTKPPPRYTQANLIKTLESEEIGRPSTYASILDRLFAQHYVTEEKNTLKPLVRGCSVRDALVGRFSFVEYDYTRAMENGLDAITEGKTEYLNLVQSADEKLEVELNALGAVKIDVPTGKTSAKPLGESSVRPLAKPSEKYCPQDNCDGHLRLKKSKSPFWGCSNYPDCSFTVDDNAGEPDFKRLEANRCPLGNKPMKRRKGKKGFFWGCTGFPDCKQTLPEKKGKPDADKTNKSSLKVSDEFMCKECSKPLIKRPSKKGKGFWWGCSGFPGCRQTYVDDDGKPKYINLEFI
jgi:DNA topoisomerase-1